MIVVVLVPCALGFHFFVRWPRDRLRRSSTIVAVADLRDTITACGGPTVVALVGTRDADTVAELLFDIADIVAVPARWLRHLPKHDPWTRARAVARIAAAQTRDPLRQYDADSFVDQLHLPF